MDWTRRHLIVAAAAGAATPAFAASAPDLAGPRAKVEALLKDHGIAGASVAVTRAGGPLWLEGFGVTKIGGEHRVDEHTLFSLQSTSKNITASATMLAVERGLIALDRPVSAYLPDFRVRSRFEAAPQDAMTPRLLLSHRAGFTHEAPVGNNYDPVFPSFDAHIASISETWLRFPVGDRYAYANLGVDLAAHILGKRAREPFEDWVAANLFGPLGMADATISPDVAGANPNRALTHQPGADPTSPRIPLLGSGAVWASAADMARYGAFHLRRGHGLMRRASWETMHALPAGGGQYGLGVQRFDLARERGDLLAYNHNGGGFGFSAIFTYIPQADIAWAVLFMGPIKVARPEPYEAFETLMRDTFLAPRYGAAKPPSVPETEPVVAGSDIAKAIVGNYLERGSDSNLVARADGSVGFESQRGFNRLGQDASGAFWVIDGPIKGTKFKWRPATAALAANFEQPDGARLVLNDRPDDPPGQEPAAFDAIAGQYQYNFRSIPLRMSVRRKNGYLYLDRARLARHADDVWYTPDGETLDLRGAQPLWRGIRITHLKA
jgi:CubicO group peptidase (beta-lactamase class C family)